MKFDPETGKAKRKKKTPARMRAWRLICLSLIPVLVLSGCGGKTADEEETQSDEAESESADEAVSLADSKISIYAGTAIFFEAEDDSDDTDDTDEAAGDTDESADDNDEADENTNETTAAVDDSNTGNASSIVSSVDDTSGNGFLISSRFSTSKDSTFLYAESVKGDFESAEITDAYLASDWSKNSDDDEAEDSDDSDDNESEGSDDSGDVYQPVTILYTDESVNSSTGSLTLFGYLFETAGTYRADVAIENASGEVTETTIIVNVLENTYVDDFESDEVLSGTIVLSESEYALSCIEDAYNLLITDFVMECVDELSDLTNESQILDLAMETECLDDYNTIADAFDAEVISPEQLVDDCLDILAEIDENGGLIEDEEDGTLSISSGSASDVGGSSSGAASIPAWAYGNSSSSDEEETTSHVHAWIARYKTVTVTEEETEIVEKDALVCSCGETFLDEDYDSDDEQYAAWSEHNESEHSGLGTCSNESVSVSVVTGTTTSEEEVIAYYVCKCGKIKGAD